MPGYKIVYFDARGRGEFLRFTMLAAGLDFEDKRISREEWPVLKPSIPSKQLPAFYLPDGRYLSQTVAIARYIAKENGMYSDDPWNSYLIEKAISIGEDIFMSLVSLMRAKTDEERMEALKNVKENTAPGIFQQWSNLLKESKTGYLAGTKQISLCDIWMIGIIDMLENKIPDIATNFKDLIAHREKILKEKPKIAEHMKNRPASEF